MEKKNNTLYLECNSGISGDMAVAALLDLGADRDVLQKALKSVPIHGFQTKISRVKKAGLDVCDFHVILEEAYENHDHDMEYLFGGEHTHSENYAHNEGHTHSESHAHNEGHMHSESHIHGEGHIHSEELSHEKAHHHERFHHAHHHEHRTLPEILHIIEHTDMTKEAKKTAGRIFEILAKAEAKAHGVPESEVHFHEVGAVDSIVDIISVAVCLDNLGVVKCIVTELCEGTGTVRCQHGVMSVPVPAVVNIVKEHQLKLSITDRKGELVTPTGAAIVAAIQTEEALPKSFRIQKIGMGGGKRAYERPSILRAMLIEEILSDVVNTESVDKTEKIQTDKENSKSGENRETDMVNIIDSNINCDDKDVIYKLETNIDDCSGEELGYVMERLLAAGARDVHYMPVYMKKNRPAYQLNVICKKEQVSKLESIIFTETTTIGIRRQKMERSVLPRRMIKVMTDLGEAIVKECFLPDGIGIRYYPEYDSVVKLCEISGKPYREVYRLVLERCER